jgi:hypothetical protein
LLFLFLIAYIPFPDLPPDRHIWLDHWPILFGALCAIGVVIVFIDITRRGLREFWTKRNADSPEVPPTEQ